MKGNCHHWNRQVWSESFPDFDVKLHEFDDMSIAPAHRSIELDFGGEYENASIIAFHVEDAGMVIEAIQRAVSHANDESKCDHIDESGQCLYEENNLKRLREEARKGRK